VRKLDGGNRLSTLLSKNTRDKKYRLSNVALWSGGNEKERGRKMPRLKVGATEVEVLTLLPKVRLGVSSTTVWGGAVQVSTALQ
jgi:hypothetical protein